MMTDMAGSGDWFEDDEASFDEAMARFEELGPQTTVGPDANSIVATFSARVGFVIVRAPAVNIASRSGFVESLHPNPSRVAASTAGVATRA